MRRTKSGWVMPVTATVCLMGFVALLVAASLQPARGPLGIDSAWNTLMESASTSVLIGVAKMLSVVGGTIVSGLVIPAVLILALLAMRRRWAATFVFLTCVLRGAVVAVVKELVGRPRPEGRLVATNSESFPSGHSASAAIIVLMLVLIFSSQRWLPYLGGLYVLAMMWSRTYLHVHWLTDTIAGALLGVAAALAVWIVLRERIARESLSGAAGGTGISSSSEKTENY
ncbi:MAG: phosphatase PAP2 family protein [Ancrocorticia sp.]|nr:phosphatase PAP2 family protein [Ancrocorticia sp.]